MLPPNYKAVIKAESAGAHSQHMNEAKTNISHVNNVARLVGVKKYDEPGPAESMAIRKVLDLPVTT